MPQPVTLAYTHMQQVMPTINDVLISNCQHSAVKVSHPTLYKIGHFTDILSQLFSVVLKKLNVRKQNPACTYKT